MRDKRGVVYAETLVAFLPIFTFFLATLQLADVSVAQLIVQHASSAAARAAAVVLPDDGAYYEDRDNATLNQFTGLRREDVEQAADLILRASPRLGRVDANVGLDKQTYALRDDLTATVNARYQCLIPALCGEGIVLSSESKLIYQGAKFVYEPTEFGDLRNGRPRRPVGEPVADARHPHGDEPSADVPTDRGDDGRADRRGRPGRRDDGSARPGRDGRSNDPRDPGRDDRGNARDPRDTRPPVAADDGRDPPRNDRDGIGPDPDRPRTPPRRDPHRPRGPPRGDDRRPPQVADRGDTPPDVDLTKPGDGPPRADRPDRPGVDLTKPEDGREGPVAVGPPPRRPDRGGVCSGGVCRPGSGACFVAGSRIGTPDGAQAIETLRPGDVVYAYDEARQAVVAQPVTQLFVRFADTLIDLTVRYASGREQVISGTPEHPFYVPEQGAYVALGALRPATLLRSATGAPAEVVSTSARSGRFQVFNFAVAGQHNYFVASAHSEESGVLVHNQDGCSRGQRQARSRGYPDPPDGYHWRVGANGEPIPVRGPNATDDYYFDRNRNEWVPGRRPTPEPLDENLTGVDRSLDDALTDFRSRLGVERGARGGGTAAVGTTDVPGLEDVLFEGASPAARAQVPSPNTTHVQNNTSLPRQRNDAEVDLANHFIDEVNRAGLSPDEVRGTLDVRVEQAVCSTCKAGLGNPNAGPGVLVQLSQRYPNLTLRITARGDPTPIYVRNGVRVNAQGDPL